MPVYFASLSVPRHTTGALSLARVRVERSQMLQRSAIAARADARGSCYRFARRDVCSAAAHAEVKVDEATFRAHTLHVAAFPGGEPLLHGDCPVCHSSLVFVCDPCAWAAWS